MMIRVDVHPVLARTGAPVDREVALELAMELDCAFSQFPSLEIRVKTDAIDASFVVSTSRWCRDDLDFHRFDDDLDRAVAGGATSLALTGPASGLARHTLAILTRSQRSFERTNAASSGHSFRRILGAHRALHDLAKPLSRADYRHALDTWHWVLRLEPEASLDVQLAALFHDVERTVSEADLRVEHRAPDYQFFKDAHARTGARMTRQILSDLCIDSDVVDGASSLVAGHERSGDDPALALLNDADALSFFSLNSNGFIDYYGVEHTRQKVRYTMGRMRRATRKRLDDIRLRGDVRALLDREMAA